MIGFLALLLCAGMAHGEEDVVAAVDARAGEFAAVAQAIWEHAELGYLEERSSALLQERLAAGFCFWIIGSRPSAVGIWVGPRAHEAAHP